MELRIHGRSGWPQVDSRAVTALVPSVVREPVPLRESHQMWSVVGLVALARLEEVLTRT